LGDLVRSRGGFGSVSHGRRQRESRVRGSLSIRGVLIVALALIALQLAVASATQAASFPWYGANNTTCWQTGSLGSPSEACDSVGAGYLPTPAEAGEGRLLQHVIGGGFGGDLKLPKNGDYCNAFGIGDELTLQDSTNEGPATGFTTPTPYSSYQERDANESACQAAGNHWGQEVRNGVSGSLCGTGHGGASCGMEHYASIGHGTNDRPWAGAFGNPSFVLSTNAGVQTFSPTGEYYGGWGFVCPEFEDTSFHGVIEYCFEEWRSPHNAPAWSGEHFQECNNPWSEIVTMFYPGTQYSTEMAGSSNTLVGTTGFPHFEAKITNANLANAARLINSRCAGWHLSENAENYVLIGVEQGVEGWDGISEIAGSAENLQMRTDYTPTPPTVSTGAASEVQQTQATLNGTVNPSGFDTHYYFQYGTSASYGSTVPTPPGYDAGAGSGATPAASAVSGLQPGTTYHYRIVASNIGGTTYGADQTLTTTPGVFFSDKSDNNSVSYWSWSSTAGWQQSFLFGHPIAAGSSPIAMTIGGLPNVFFVDASRGNQLTDWAWSPSAGWQQSFIATDPVTAGTSPSGIVVNGTPHVFFVDANDNNTITDLTMSGASWQQVPLFGHAVAKGSSPAAVISSGGSPQVFFADGANGNSITAWTQTPSWQQAPFSGDAVAAGSSPSVVVNNGTTNIFFADATKGGTVADWTWSPTSLQLNPFYGHQVMAGSSPSAVVNNGSAQVFFADANDSNTISAWTWSPTSLQQSTLFGDPVAAGSSPVARLISGAANIYFADAPDNNAISVWKWTSSSLQQTALFGHPVASGSSPSN
jgi:hypothetical protein